MTIRCEIISQDALFYQGDADLVILANSGRATRYFAQSFSPAYQLEYGIIRVRQDGEEMIFTVRAALLMYSPTRLLSWRMLLNA